MTIWCIYIGGKPVILVPASTVWQAVAQFVDGDGPLLGRLADGQLTVDYQGLRFVVRPYTLRRAA